MLEAVPADQASQVQEGLIQAFEPLGQEIPANHRPQIARGSQPGGKGQEDEGHQQHGQELHQQIQPQVTAVTLVGQAPVDHRKDAQQDQGQEQAGTQAGRDMLAEDAGEKGHEGDRHG